LVPIEDKQGASAGAQIYLLGGDIIYRLPGLHLSARSIRHDRVRNYSHEMEQSRTRPHISLTKIKFVRKVTKAEKSTTLIELSTKNQGRRST